MPPRRSFNKTDPIQGRTKQEQERLVNYYESRRPYMLVRAQNQATKKYN